MIQNHPHPNHTLIRLPALLKLVRISRSSVYLRLDPKSKYFDASFPRPIPLSSESRGGVAWLLSEINLWIESRIQVRDTTETIAKEES